MSSTTPATTTTLGTKTTSVSPVSLSSPPSTPPEKSARSGLAMARRGLVNAGRARVEAAFASSPNNAHVLVALGEIRRRASDWDGAAEIYAQLASLFSAAGQRHNAAVAAALAVDGAILAHGIDAAEATIGATTLNAVERAPAEALLACARGHAMEGRQKMRGVDDASGGNEAWSSSWLSLIQADVMLEIGALTGAEQSLAKTAPSLSSDRFSEIALRHRWLAAWSAVLTAGARRNEKDFDPRVAERAVSTLARYALAFPLYRAHAEQLAGEVALLTGADPSSSFAAALAWAARAHAPFLRARLLARQAIQTRASAEARTQHALDSARTALLDAGASARAGALVPKAMIDRGTQRKSIAVRLEQADAAASDAQGLEAVVEVSRYLASIRDLPTLLEKTLDAVVRVMRAERGVLFDAHEGDVLRAVAARGVDLDDVHEGSTAITFSVVRAAQQSGEAVLSDNALADDRFKDRKSVVATDIRSVMCSPIRTRNRTFGYLYLDRRVLDVAFGDEQQDLLAAFCTQVAVAWENAIAFDEIAHLNAGLEAKVKERTLELRESLEQLSNTRLKLAEAQRDALEKEMTLARDIQRTILPAEELATGPGVKLFGTVLPASYCGGDFWSWAKLDDERSLLIVADVTGHGVAASLITAVARACLDTLSLSGEARSPAAVLRTMNDVIHNAAAGRLCATAFAVVVDAKSRSLTFASAGHNPPWHVAAKDGACSPLLARGRRLGEESDARFDETTASYADGDRLLLYTDGVVEWPGPKGKPYGDRRLRKVLEASWRKAPAELVAAVHEDAKAFAAGTERDDDLTLVAVELSGA